MIIWSKDFKTKIQVKNIISALPVKGNYLEKLNIS